MMTQTKVYSNIEELVLRTKEKHKCHSSLFSFITDERDIKEIPEKQIKMMISQPK